MSETPLNQDQNSDEIDLRDIILPLWRSRKQILTTAIVFAIFGGIIGFLTPTTYTASSTFLPQTNKIDGMAGSIGGLAALAGINLNAPMAGGDIPPSMYSTVLASEPFRERILDSEIWVNGDSLTYRNHLENHPKSVLKIAYDYLLSLIKEIEKKSVESEKTLVVGELKTISDEEFELHKELDEKISILNDKKEGVVTLIVEESDPLIAAQIAKVTEEVLQDWIIEHKIRNTKAQYDFISKQFVAKQKELFSIQDQLAGYMDRNQNVLSASYLTRLERLQAEFDLVNTVYSELAKQKEQAAIQLSKDTPTFSVLDPVTVPKEKAGPKRSLYILIAFFLGLIFSVGWFLVKKQINEFLINVRIIRK
jgi:uncharacterized protein involved in exopolysaccharide biosynthesis